MNKMYYFLVYQRLTNKFCINKVKNLLVSSREFKSLKLSSNI